MEQKAPSTWLMIKDGEVINRIVWDGNTETWQPPEGVEMQLAKKENGDEQ